MRKAFIALQTIKMKPLYDAMLELEGSRKKVGKFIAKEIKYFALKKLKEEGMDLKRVHVKSIICHRFRRVKKHQYKSRGQSGVRKEDYSYFNIEFIEYTEKDFVKKLVQGETPVMYSYLLQEHLKQKEADFEEINRVQFLLNEKGKKMQRVFLNRRAMKRKVELLKEGRVVDLEILKELQQDEEADEVSEKFGYLLRNDQIQRERRLEARKLLVKGKK